MRILVKIVSLYIILLILLSNTIILSVDAEEHTISGILSIKNNNKTKDIKIICGTSLYNNPNYLKLKVKYLKEHIKVETVEIGKDKLLKAKELSGKNVTMKDQYPTFNLSSQGSAINPIKSEISRIEVNSSKRLNSEIKPIGNALFMKVSPTYYTHIMCKGYDVNWKPVNPTTIFKPNDAKAVCLMDICMNSKVESKWYYRSDSHKGWVYYGSVTSTGHGCYHVAHWIYIKGHWPGSCSLFRCNYPRAWKVDVYIDGIYKFSEYFEITDGGLRRHCTCERVDSKGNPINVKTKFVIGKDSKVVYHLRFDHAAYYNERTKHVHDAKIVWYKPNGKIYKSSIIYWPDYKDRDIHSNYWDYIWSGATSCDQLIINENTPTGTWKVEVYLDQYYDHGWKWYGPICVDRFTIEPPPKKPDLKPIKIELKPQGSQNEELKITYYIKNVGEGVASGKFWNYLYVDGKLVRRGYYEGRVYPGGTVYGSKTVELGIGKHEIKIVADAIDSIDESNEENNQMTIYIYVFKYYEYNQKTGKSVQKKAYTKYWGKTSDGHFEIYYDMFDSDINSAYLSNIAYAAVRSWSKLVPYLGKPYDQDGDGRIEILIVNLNRYNERSYSSICGYVQSYDVNGLGLIYIDDNLDEWAGWEKAKQAVSHEFTHRIQLSYDRHFDEKWICEGMAQFGGDYAWNFRGTYQSYVDTFRYNPDVSLTGNSYESCYCAAYVFFEFLAEKYGTSIVKEILTQMKPWGKQGWTAIEKATGASRYDLFDEFVIKNYIGDYKGTANTFEGIYMRAKPTKTHSVTSRVCGSGSVNKWAADYIEFTTSQYYLKMTFSGYTGRSFKVKVIKVETFNPPHYSVSSLSLTNNRGDTTVNNANKFSRISMAIIRYDDGYSTACYNYEAEAKQKPKPKIEIGMKTIDFSKARIKKDIVVRNTYIKNVGNAQLRVESISRIKGSNEFKYVYPKTPFTLDPGKTKTIEFKFEPKTLGYKEAVFVIKSNDPENPELRITLRGTGVDWIKDIKIEPNYWTAYVGDTKQFKVKAYYASGKEKDVTYSAEWSSSNLNVVRHLGNGKFKAVRVGEATITVKYNGVTDTAQVTVLNRPPTVSLSYPPNGATLAGNIVTLKWKGYDPDGDSLRYDLYFGTKNPPPLFKQNIRESEYRVPIESGTTYYWKVKVKDVHGAEDTSDIWWFKVAEIPKEYILTVKTSGLAQNLKTKLTIIGNGYSKEYPIDDQNPITVKLKEGIYTVKVEEYVYDNAKMTRYHCPEPEKQITLNSNKEVTFYYKSEYKLVTKVQPENGGTILITPKKEWFRENERVTLKAIPNDGFKFEKWLIQPYGLKCGKCIFENTTNPIKIKMDRPKTVIAIFNPIKKMPPIAKFDFIPKAPQVGQEITFDASSSYDPDGTIVKYKWDFGDGTTAEEGKIVRHTYSKEGTYTVTLTVTDNDGLINSTSKLITVSNETLLILQPPKLNLSVNGNGILTVILDKAPNGLSGYNITITIENSSIAEITAVEFPQWANMKDNSTLPSSSVWIKAVDLGEKVQAGSKNVTLAKLRIKAKSEGTTTITVKHYAIDDDRGDKMDVEVIESILKVVKLPPLPPYCCPHCKLPTDPDNDGLYEDLNGNGRIDFDDVVRFFKCKEWIEKNYPVEVVDFNGNGRVDFNDIVVFFKTEL